MEKLIVLGYRNNRIVYRSDVQPNPQGGTVLRTSVGHPDAGITLDRLEIVTQEYVWTSAPGEPQVDRTRPEDDLHADIDRQNAAGLEDTLRRAGRLPHDAPAPGELPGEAAEETSVDRETVDRVDRLWDDE